MTDTSDGFSGDLGHVCEASGVGAEVVREDIPVDEAVREAARVLGRDPYELVLGESDDYDYRHVRPAPRGVPSSVAAGCAAVPFTDVGRITAGKGTVMS